jgi:hypothetical protein
MIMLRVWIETIQLFEYGNRTKNLFKCEIETLSNFSKGTRTHAYVYDNQILLYYFFIGLLFFIPWSWWWWFSIFDEWQVVPMKLDIVYMDTISLDEFHCTSVWEVYSWTIYQRLAFENMFSREVCILRGPGKREIWKPVFCTSRGGFVEREFVSCSLILDLRYLYVL